VTEKPNVRSGPLSPGQPAGSPFDAPTGEFPTVKTSIGTDIPRTDDELGLEPEVPATSAEARTEKLTREPAPAGEPTAATYAFATIPPAPPTAGEGAARLRRPRADTRRGTQDLGLLGLRLVIGLTFLYHGLQKLAGWFHGPGLGGTRDMLQHGGWKHVELSASMLTVAEVGGGILIILGLATPLAAGAVLASITDAWLWKEGMAPGFQYKTVELESILAALSAVLILTGPGRLSFDRNRGWATRPMFGSLAVLILALVAAAVSWFYLHGGNPFHGIYK
jgi:putative oxidoreductase